MGFANLDEGILKSSIMAEDPATFKVFIAFLAACDLDGVARVAPPYIAAVCRLSDGSVMQAIQKLESPDPTSRSVEDEGRRIRRVDGGWYIINYHKYREESKKDYLKRKQKAYRDKAVPDSPEAPLSWRTNSEEGFKIYEKDASDAYDALLKDKEWMADQKMYHPNLDIELSLQKAFNEFWGVKAGWFHKRKSRTVDIDWKATFTNALTQRMNWAWQRRDGFPR